MNTAMVELNDAYSPAGKGDANLLDLRRIFAMARRRQWLILATVAIVFGLTIIAYAITKPSYTAVARVALDRRVDELVATANPNVPPLATDSSSVDTELQVLTSPRIAAAVVDRLKLAQAPADGAAMSPAQAREAAIDEIRSGLRVKREGVSYAIQISYSSEDPAKATAIVNAVADEYVNGQLADKERLGERETNLLRERLTRLRADVIQADAAVARYRAANNLVDVAKDSTFSQQEIATLNTQLATAQAQQAEAEARLAAANSSNAAVQSDALGSPLIRDLRAQLARISVERADLAGRYGELHPNLAKVNRQLADVNASIAGETARIRASYDAEARVARGRTASIQASINRARGTLSAGNSASVQLNELERRAEAARTLYESLLSRYSQKVTAQGTERSNAYIIANARVPAVPDSPKLAAYLLGGAIAGLLAAIGAVLLMEILESGLRSRLEAERKLGLPVLASVPDLATIPGKGLRKGDPMSPAEFLVANEGSVFNEAFRSIRTALKLGQDGQNVRSIAISSALPNEGKTTVSICLARSAALSGLRVVLVDCDLRRRASSRSMADQVEAGLVEVLKGEASIEQALIRDSASGAWVLPQKPSNEHNYDLIASQAMASLIASLGSGFDLVVLDTPPVLPLAEARAVAAMADTTLLAVRWRTTPTYAAKMALDQLGRAGARVTGSLLTLVNLREQARSGYGDEMVYYKKFASYYS